VRGKLNPPTTAEETGEGCAADAGHGRREQNTITSETLVFAPRRRQCHRRVTEAPQQAPSRLPLDDDHDQRAGSASASRT